MGLCPVQCWEIMTSISSASNPSPYNARLTLSWVDIKPKISCFLLIARRVFIVREAENSNLTLVLNLG